MEDRKCKFCGTSFCSSEAQRKYCFKTSCKKKRRSIESLKYRESKKGRDYIQKWKKDHPGYQSEYYAKNKDRLREYSKEYRKL